MRFVSDDAFYRHQVSSTTGTRACNSAYNMTTLTGRATASPGMLVTDLLAAVLSLSAVKVATAQAAAFDPMYYLSSFDDVPLCGAGQMQARH